jgi:GNAT superfamily N-acetyltransferase
MSGYHLREATVADAAVLARQRRLMFEAMGSVAAEEAPALEAAARAWLERAMPENRFRGWVVEHDGVPVAGGGLWLRDLMPRPRHTDGEAEPRVMSMWTDPDHRRRGLARLVMDAILEWCRANGMKAVTLSASPDGRALYEQLGFKAAAREMALEL